MNLALIGFLFFVLLILTFGGKVYRKFEERGFISKEKIKNEH
jgi:ABC-type microcin C transport system permease subunit YejB